MSPRATWVVAGLVFREAIASRYMLGLFAFIGVLLIALLFALDLEVVDGALAAGRLFGDSFVQGRITAVDVGIRPLFELVVSLTFFGGILFGIVAFSDIAPRLFSPGRVELLLSLPLRRTELTLGTFVGVNGIALLGACVAIGGSSAVMLFKARIFTAAPLWGAVFAFLGFFPVYGAMILAASFIRSAAVSAGAGLVVFIAGIITSERALFLGLIEPGLRRDVTSLLIAPLPRMRALAHAGVEAATGQPFWQGDTSRAVWGSLAFAAAALALAVWRVNEKDY